jgi:hypothetical protein
MHRNIISFIYKGKLGALNPPSTFTNFCFFLIFQHNTENSDTIDFREYLLCTLFLITLGSPKINFIKALFQVVLYSGVRPRAVLSYVFFGFQLNSNPAGQVSREEFYDSVKNSLVKLTKEKIDSLFIDIDEGNKGFITFGRLVLLIRMRANTEN